jgi:hypothetical protein
MELSERMQKRIAEGKKWLAKTADETPAQLVERLAEYERALDAELAGLTDAQWTFKPAPDEWSIREVCLHVANSVRGVAMLTELLSAGQDGPEKVRMSVLDADEGQSAADIQNQLRQDFQRSAAASELLQGGYDTEKTTEHPFFGPLDGKEWAVFNLMHVSIHLQQIERIKSDANFPK